ncbi:MarR family transcriptional regulator [Streptomyces sp. NPDC058623]|uniref:MarR family transcriptional regulator n=1 Tax=Streptomyces sp. NPDC058623 TaxID=3346563 RepID=UPI003657DF23
MLDVLVARRHVKLVSLAGLMEVNPSTAMRMVDRLIASGLADRRPNRENRRETVLTATDSGSRLVKAVTARRRAETSTVLARLGPVEAVDGLAGPPWQGPCPPVRACASRPLFDLRGHALGGGPLDPVVPAGE